MIAPFFRRGWLSVLSALLPTRDFVSEFYFNSRTQPLVVIGAAGSARSELLLRITGKAIRAKKTVFHIDNRNCHSLAVKVFAMSEAANRQANCYIDRPIHDPDGYDRPCYDRISKDGGVLLTMFPALEKATGELREQSSESIIRIVQSIRRMKAQLDSVIVIDECFHVSAEATRELRDLAAEGADVVLGYSGAETGLGVLDLQLSRAVVLLRTCGTTIHEQLQSRGLEIKPDEIASLQPGQGFAVDFAARAIKPMKFGGHRVVIEKDLVIKFANKRPQPA